MKVKRIELEYDDLVTLFSDGTFSSPLDIHIVGNKKRIREFKERHKGDCCEDLWAKWLIEEKGFLALDASFYAEDEEEEKEFVKRFSLSRVNKMINKAINDKDVAWNVINLMEGNDDFYTGYNLLQYIAFGEIVFG